MKKISVLTVALLGLAALAGAKSYGISLSSPAKVGNLELKPDNYSVKLLKGNDAVFTDHMGKKYETKARVENGTRKFNYTAVESHRVNGVEHIDGIELSGTRTTLAFN